MQARIVPARQGAAWLVDGWRLFRAAPLGWLAMVFAYWIIMTLASVVPFIGVAAASISRCRVSADAGLVLGARIVIVTDELTAINMCIKHLFKRSQLTSAGRQGMYL